MSTRECCRVTKATMHPTLSRARRRVSYTTIDTGKRMDAGMRFLTTQKNLAQGAGAATNLREYDNLFFFEKKSCVEMDRHQRNAC